jgi:hypothetical protein
MITHQACEVSDRGLSLRDAVETALAGMRTRFRPYEELLKTERDIDLTDFLYQRDRETIASVRLDPAVTGTD